MNWLIITPLLLASALVATNCAPKTTEKKAKVVTDCILPDEQINTLQGKWSAPPIKLSFRTGNWGGDEVSAIQAGADTWNKFFTASRELTLFEAGPAGSGNQSVANQAGPDCRVSATAGGGPDGVVIYKRQTDWTGSKTVAAVTSTCYQVQSNDIPLLINAIIEINYKNFFTAGAENLFPDLQSVATHELGHLMGLDHSCGPLGRPNQTKDNIECPDYNTNPDHELVKAVMFPKQLCDGTRQCESKRDLTANDQGRANCLYE